MTNPANKPTSGTRRLKYLFGLLALAAVAGFLFLRSVPAELHEVAPGDVQAEVMGTGTLEARFAATISPKITGRLASVTADQGDRVEAGQVLATLDDAEARQQLAVAEASLGVASATVARVRTDQGRAQAVLSQARVEHARAVSLAENHSMAESDRDKAVEKLHVAEAVNAREDLTHLRSYKIDPPPHEGCEAIILSWGGHLLWLHRAGRWCRGIGR